MDWETATRELAKKLDPAHVLSRRQGGTQVQYVEGWRAIAEANRIFGHGSWARETLELRLLGDPREVEGKWRVEYLARVRITVWLDGSPPVTRDGCGFGQGIDRDVGQAHESALKEAETDAMKRGLMTFGNPFGLALYDKSRENVGIDLPDPSAVKAQLLACGTLADLQSAWKALPPETRAERIVIQAKDQRKDELSQKDAA